jgi:hypothetical protein
MGKRAPRCRYVEDVDEGGIPTAAPPKPKGGWNRKEGAAPAAASPYMMFSKAERWGCRV